MALKDANCSTGQLGYRISGLAGYPREQQAELELHLKAVEVGSSTEMLFFSYVVAAASDVRTAQQSARTILRQLECLCEVAKASPFVAAHEFIGSSLLFVTDCYGRCRVAWIDFANTSEAPGLTHQ